MNFIRSPINYTGNKFRLLDEIFIHFPNNINTFLDVFGGSGCIVLNVQAKHKIYNEFNRNISEMFNCFQIHTSEDIIKHINKRINEFNLGRYIQPKYLNDEEIVQNEIIKQNYLNFRQFINEHGKHPLDLLTIHYYSFNNLLRFSQKSKNLNSPIGKRQFSVDKHGILIQNACNKSKNINCMSLDFRDIDFSILKNNDFVYFDPPYFLSYADYNKDWSKKEELELYEICDTLTKNNIKWAMSNMLVNNNIEHSLLKEWCIRKNYKIHFINHNYSGWTGTKNETYKNTQEVLITNY